MMRLLFVLIGYAFGLFQTGYFLGKLQGFDLRTQGSGNYGATNALRVKGLKTGLIVLFFDSLKAFIPVFTVRMIYKEQDIAYVYAVYTALGAMLGNSYPFYLHFNGGKGVAAMLGWGLALDWRITLIAVVIFFTCALTTRYVSLSSMLVCPCVAIMFFIFRYFGLLSIPEARFTEFICVIIVLGLLVIYRHKANVKRLIAGNENRFGKKK